MGVVVPGRKSRFDSQKGYWVGTAHRSGHGGRYEVSGPTASCQRGKDSQELLSPTAHFTDEETEPKI